MAETTSIVVSNFKGLDERWKGEPGSADQAQDLAWDPHGGWRSAGGYRRLLLGQENQQGAYVDPFTGHGKVTSLHWFAQGNGARQWLVYEATFASSPPSATLCALNPSSRTSTCYTILTDRGGNEMTGRNVSQTPYTRTRSCAWNDWLYLVNGVDMPVVFHGYTSDRAGFDTSPGAPNATEITRTTGTAYGALASTAVIVDGLGMGPIPLRTDVDDDGTYEVTPYKAAYRYKVTFVNIRGQESPASAASNTVRFQNGSTVAIAHGAKFVRVDIPTGGDHVVARRVYRTQNMLDTEGNPVLGAGDAFYFWGEIPDNDQRQFEDYLPDANLGSKLDESRLGIWPLDARMPTRFGDRMYLVVGAQLMFSQKGYPEMFGDGNIIDFGDDKLGPITAMYATRKALVVFKARGIYFVIEESSGPEKYSFSSETGCIAPDSLVEIPDAGLAFVAASGIFMLKGTLQNEGVPTELIHLSEPLPDTLNSLNTAALVQAQATLYPNEREAWFAVPLLGFANNSHVLVFHYATRDWTIRPYFPISGLITTQDHRGYVIFGSWADNADTSPDGAVHEGLFVYSRGWDDKAGTAITPVYETQPMDFGRLFRSLSVNEVALYCVGYGNTDLAIDYRVNRDVTYTRALLGADPLTEAQQYLDANHQMDVYGVTAAEGVAAWDTATWGAWRPIVRRFAVNTTEVNPTHEFQARWTPEEGTRHMEVIGASMEVLLGEQRKIKSLADITRGGNG